MAKTKSTEDFIKIWQTSQTIQEVMRKTGQIYQTVYHRARRLRIEGVPLKELVVRDRQEAKEARLKALKKLARSLNDQ